MVSKYLCIKVDAVKRVMHLSDGKKSVIVPVFATVKTDGGFMHLSGTVKVAELTHDCLGRKFDKTEYETWNSPDLKQSRMNFINLCHRFK